MNCLVLLHHQPVMAAPATMAGVVRIKGGAWRPLAWTGHGGAARFWVTGADSVGLTMGLCGD